MSTIFNIRRGMILRQKARPLSTIISWSIVLAASQAFGCSAATPPAAIFTQAELTLRKAAEARADEFAPMDLQRAKDNLENARKALAAGKNDEARRLVEIAHVEAELAEARADAEITRLAAEKLRQRGDALRQELESAARRAAPAENNNE